MNPKIKKSLVALLVAPLLVLTGCGVTTASDETRIRVGAGPFEDPKVKGCIAPGTKDNSITNDNYDFAYPTSDRDLDATGQEGADFDPITVVSKDNAEMAVPVTLRFNQVTDCDTLKDFYESFGKRYDARLDDGQATAGYLLMLRKLMYDPIDTTLDEIAKDYNWRDLYNNPAAQNELATTLKERVGDIVDENARGHFFENFTVLMKKPFPTNPELADAIASEQAAVGRAQSAEAEARAKKLQAEAEVAVAKAQALKKKAEIEGYGGFENYNRARAVEEGLNPYQPTYKVSSTN